MVIWRQYGSLKPGQLTRSLWRRMEQAGTPERHGSCDVVAGRKSGKSEAMAALRWAEGWSMCPLWGGEEGAEDSMWKVCEREEQLLKSEFFGHRGHRDETKGGELSSSIIDERPRCSEEDEAASCSVISEARSRWDKSCLFSSSAHRRSNSIWVKDFDNEYHQFVCLFSVSCLSCLPCLPSNSCLSWCLSLCFLALLSLWSLLPFSSPTQSG